MDLTLKVWRQDGPGATGQMETQDVRDISPDMSFLEMLDIVNDRLVVDGKEPIAFEHDCREGICGSCGFMVNGQADGPELRTAGCQLELRQYRDGAHLTIQAWRAGAVPLVHELLLDPTPLAPIIGNACD